MDDFNIFTALKPYIGEVFSLLGAVGAFFVGKRARTQQEQKVSTDITSSELENVEAALRIYRGMLEDLQIKLDAAQQAYTLLEDRFHAAANKNRAYEETILDLEIKLKNCKGK